MSGRDAKTKPRRIVLERADGVEQIRVRAKLYWAAILFIPVWLFIWTVGLVVGVADLVGDFELVKLLWLALVAAVWLLGAAMLGWHLIGSEILRVVRGDLEIGFRLLGLGWTRRFPGHEVSGLTVADAPPYRAGRAGWLYPGEGSSVRLKRRGRTIHAATGVDEAAAQAIVEHLRKRLPKGAFEAER